MVDTDTIQLSDEAEIDNIRESSSTSDENKNAKIVPSLGSDNENDSSSGNTTTHLGNASSEVKILVEDTKVDEHEIVTETESEEDGTECLTKVIYLHKNIFTACKRPQIFTILKLSACIKLKLY